MTSRVLKCIDNQAYVDMATEQAKAIRNEALAWVALQVAIFAAQQLLGNFISGRQRNLAERRYQMGREAMDHAKMTWPYERSFVSDTMAEPIPVTEYSQAQIMLNETQRVQDVALEASDRYLSRLGLSSTACNDSRMNRGMAVIRTDLVAHAMRTAEALTIALSDRRYSRQVAAVALGKGKLQAALGLGAMADSGSSIGTSLMKTINSGMTLWGYMANRWTHGGNYVTGTQGAPHVIPAGYQAVQRTNPYGVLITTLERRDLHQQQQQQQQQPQQPGFLNAPDEQTP